MVTYLWYSNFFYSMKEKNTNSIELKKLGERIKSLRLKRGYTNYENFAYDNDLPRAQFGRYENGQDLRYTSLVKVVKALGVSMEEFFSEGFD